MQYLYNPGYHNIVIKIPYYFCFLQRKLTDVLDLGDSKNEKDSGNSSDDDETFQYADEEMRLRRIAGHPVSERNSDDNDSDEDGDEKMEEDEAPK